ncbi:MAG: restriction endonuclease subunit S [Calditrichaeota bacterium]|nr:MAG: restriction endonuclease subunit S [Calditrichota bacterium]
MELKTGYKNTVIGVIPEDWEIEIIRNFSNPVRGGSPRPAGSPLYFNGNYIPWLTVASLTNIPNSQLFVYKTDTFLTKAGSYFSRTLEKNTLIIANSGATLGVAKILGIKCCANDGIAALLNIDKKINERYLVYFINTLTQSLRERIATGNGQPNLNTDLIGNIQIPLPPLPEQTAIATVLSDTDSLIQALEKKIAKKQLIKKGAMQKLLTPKDDWEVKTLGDFLIYEQPTKYIVKNTKYNDNFDIPVLTAGKTFILGYSNEKKGIFNNYPVIIFDDFTTASKYVKFPFKVKSSAMKILKPKNENVNLRFIFEIMQQINFPLGDHKRHWIGEFQPLEIKVPKSKEEKNRISQILSDMDNEIETLQNKLSKYKQLKQGLMQNLLTGKIRLV